MEVTGAKSVLVAINQQGGVYICGRFVPIWVVVIVEFCLAFGLEMLLGSPLSFKLASRIFDPRKNHPMMFETAIICATVGIMCSAMSFIAAWLYYPYYAGFDVLTLLANWLKLVCFNFPFAFFGQLFFIQPFVRFSFKQLFRKDIEAREKEIPTHGKQKSKNEIEAIEDIYNRMDEIKKEVMEEIAEMKKEK